MDSSENNQHRPCYRSGLGDLGDDVMPPLYRFGRPGSDSGFWFDDRICEAIRKCKIEIKRNRKLPTEAKNE